MSLAHVYGTILAGGSGTRFWPLSRERFPKQLLNIVGEETLIQQTVRRVLSAIPTERICIVTNPFQAESITLQLREWKDDLRENVFLEPEGRNTAPAIGLAAQRLVARDPQAIMLILPADHVIQGARKFKQAVSLGARLAREGRLVTFGVPPSRPECGYGYIRPDVRVCLRTQGGLSGHPVARFVEKPSLAKAKHYVKQGTWLWNSGIFMWQASTLLEELARFQPVLFSALHAYDVQARKGASSERLLALYRQLPAVSIDHGVMEHSARSAVIPVEFSWSDVGSWSNLREVAPLDDHQNVTIGRVVAMDSDNNVLFGDQRLVAAIGLSHMVVVDTPDATLVCPQSRSQDVKQLVAQLQRQKAPELVEHRTVFRPWGSYTVLEEGKNYKIKKVTVRPGSRLSLQVHQHRSEHWVVIAGTARVIRGDDIFDLQRGESTMIPQQTQHRLANEGSTILELIEVQNGSYVGEDDITRIHDDYERIEPSTLPARKKSAR